MPFRRRLLAASGICVAGLAGASYATETPTTVSGRADWPMARFDPACTGATEQSGPVTEPTLRWHKLDGTRFTDHAPPALLEETLVATGDRSFAALNRDNGDLQFERNFSHISGPTLARADAYRHDVIAVRGTTGIYGLSSAGGFEVAGIDVGLQRWHTPQAAPPNPTGVVRKASTVAVDGVIYGVVPETNRIVAIDANSGRLRWERKIGRDAHPEANRPAVRNGTVFATSPVDTVVALDAETGATKWEVGLPELDTDARRYREPNAPTATEMGVLVPTRAGILLLDAKTGERHWEYVHEGRAMTGTAAVADGTVVVTDGRDTLHGISLDDGEALWQSSYRPDTHPIIADGIIYLTYHTVPELHAFELETGDHLWERDIPATPSQPVVSDGDLYLSTFEGILALGDDA